MSDEEIDTGGGRRLTVTLTKPQVQWLTSSASAATPRLLPAERLVQILDEAIAASRIEERTRAHQLAIYTVSGYPEHHPDYPHTPQEK
jgi:hypothetical protein